MGSSVGVTKAHDSAELRAAIALALEYDRRVVVEEAIDGRELEMSVLGNEQPIASVAGEVVPCNEFYDFNAKYVDDDSDLIIPADVSPEKLAEMQEIAIRSFRALDLAGMARVDFFLERGTDRLVLNEVNTIPGFTSISMYPMLWAASGIPLAELVDRLIELAVDRHSQPRRVI
jgi:D-alanine-D-alanine ligase